MFNDPLIQRLEELASWIQSQSDPQLRYYGIRDDRLSEIVHVHFALILSERALSSLRSTEDQSTNEQAIFVAKPFLLQEKKRVPDDLVCVVEVNGVIQHTLRFWRGWLVEVTTDQHAAIAVQHSLRALEYAYAHA